MRHRLQPAAASLLAAVASLLAAVAVAPLLAAITLASLVVIPEGNLLLDRCSHP